MAWSLAEKSPRASLRFWTACRWSQARSSPKYRRLTRCLARRQICAARPPQLALAPLLPSLRPDLTASTEKLSSRLALFAKCLATVPGWTVAASGAFYAYVRHPFEGICSEDVSRKLAETCGVVTLPGSFFMPEPGTPAEDVLVRQGSALLEDRWIRRVSSKCLREQEFSS